MAYKIPHFCDIREKKETYEAVKPLFELVTDLEKKGVELLGACVNYISDEVYIPERAEEKRYFEAARKERLLPGDAFIPMITPEDIKPDKMYLRTEDLGLGEYHKEIAIGLKITKPIKNKTLGKGLTKFKERTFEVKDEKEELKVGGFGFPENKDNFKELIIDK